MSGSEEIIFREVQGFHGQTWIRILVGFLWLCMLGVSTLIIVMDMTMDEGRILTFEVETSIMKQ